MYSPFQTVSSRIVYENQWIRVREDKIIRPNGEPGIYSVVETKDSVIIGAINAKNEIYLHYSFSYPAQSWQWELPGGSSDGEELVSAAKRELREETGLEAQNWVNLPATRVCDGLMPERMATLIATDLHSVKKPTADDDGVIHKGQFFSFDEVHAMIDRGDIDEGQSITALYLIERYLASQ